MRDQVAVLFGGGGFVGRRAAARLAADGWCLRVASRDPERAHALRSIGDVGQLTIEPWRPERDEDIEKLLDGASAAINFVGLLFERKAGDFVRAHEELPARLARLAAEKKVGRFVQISSLGVDRNDDAAYARTKFAGEKAVRAAFPAATILRPSVVFGRGDGFLNRFAQMASIAPALPAIGGGAMRFQPIAVDDVADAIAASLERDDVAGETYELGGPKTYSLKEILRLILDVTGKKRLIAPLPWAIAEIQARFFEFLPTPPLTRDQLKLLRHDNVVSDGAKTLADLALRATPMESQAPDILAAYTSRK